MPSARRPLATKTRYATPPPKEAVSRLPGVTGTAARREAPATKAGSPSGDGPGLIPSEVGSIPALPTMHRVNVRFHLPTKDGPGRTLSLLPRTILRGAQHVTDQFRTMHTGIQGTSWPAPTRALITLAADTSGSPTPELPTG